MKQNKKTLVGGSESNQEHIGSDFFERSWGESWTYIKTVVNVLHEPILILNKDFKVLAANDPFYQTFKVNPRDTENKIVYELGNGQWNIPSLRKLLEDILPKDTFFKGFEVTHEFPMIGRKMMILNARQIHPKAPTGKVALKLFEPIILLAMEDVTDMMAVAEKLALHTQQFETELKERTSRLEVNFKDIEKWMEDFKKRV